MVMTMVDALMPLHRKCFWPSPDLERRQLATIIHIHLQPFQPPVLFPAKPVQCRRTAAQKDSRCCVGSVAGRDSCKKPLLNRYSDTGLRTTRFKSCASWNWQVLPMECFEQQGNHRRLQDHFRHLDRSCRSTRNQLVTSATMHCFNDILVSQHDLGAILSRQSSELDRSELMFAHSRSLISSEIRRGLCSLKEKALNRKTSSKRTRWSNRRSQSRRRLHRRQK